MKPFDDEAFQSYFDQFQKSFNFSPFGENQDFQHYLQDMLQQSMSNLNGLGTGTGSGYKQGGNSGAGASRSRIKHDMFETHDYFIVKIPFADYDPIHTPRLLLSSHEMSLTGKPGEGTLLSIHLPRTIDPKKTRADYRNGIIEIRMRKDDQEPVTEISITGM